MKVSARAARQKICPREYEKLESLIEPCENEGFCARNAPEIRPRGYKWHKRLGILINPCEDGSRSGGGAYVSPRNPLSIKSHHFRRRRPQTTIYWPLVGWGGVGGGFSGLRGHGGWGVGGWVYERPGRAPAGGPPPPLNQWLDQ